MTYRELEDARKRYARKVWCGWGIALALMAVAFVATVGFFAGTAPQGFAPGVLAVGVVPCVFILVIVAIIMMLASRKDAFRYRQAYKAYFVWRNLERNFTNLHYNHTAGMAQPILAETGMVDTGTVYDSNDLVLGQYKKVRFVQADVHMQNVSTDSNGHTTYHTIFKGRWMVFEFPKKFNFRMMVVTHKFRAVKVPKSRENGKKFHKIRTESTDFNKNFIVYGEDGFEAFYLLDPAMIARIENLRAVYGRPFILCFVENRLQVGLDDGHDSFEPPSALHQINPEAEDAKIDRDIKVITNLVDELSLDKKLFKD